ncbi:hypothetical protein ACKVMT_10875 [Halobacteriales archaeon Cl-PHB]
MRQSIEALAVGLVLVGFLLFSAAETTLVGSLLVAGGAYALILPQFIRPQNPAPSRT